MEIIEASIMHLVLYQDYIKECNEGGISYYDEAVANPEKHLKAIVAYAKGRQLPEGWVPITTYFCIDDNCILGAIRVRQGSNDYIKNVIGHVGYETRPSARGRGVAQALLTWVKERQIVDEVMLICSESNIASKQVIERCGGQFSDSAYDEENCETRLRYVLSKIS